MVKMASIVTVALGTLCAASWGTSPAGATPASGQALAGPAAAVSPIEQAGCYRLGETGYHWYRFCLGPQWVYPHHRVCHHGYCYYQ